MNVKWANVKEDYARKDAEIEALKEENKNLKEEIENLGYELIEAYAQGEG